MMRFSNLCLTLSLAVVVGVIYFVYVSFSSHYFEINSSENVLLDKHTGIIQHKCIWKEGDPVIYHLKTKMGVNYDAGHWFHMAENFMTQHSILRNAGELTNSSQVFYSFDKSKYIILYI